MLAKICFHMLEIRETKIVFHAQLWFSTIIPDLCSAWLQPTSALAIILIIATVFPCFRPNHLKLLPQVLLCMTIQQAAPLYSSMWQ